MIQTFGNYQELPENYLDFLTLNFSPSSLPLKKRWRNNGLSADFIADYFKSFFINQIDNSLENEEQRVYLENLKLAVKYVANELLENAMKFQDDTLPCKATIQFLWHANQLLFYVTNAINSNRVPRFQKLIQTILTGDPQQLYLQTMQSNTVLELFDSRSGLGLLSMICDYSADLAWKFQTITTPFPVITVSTMVCLKIDQL